MTIKFNNQALPDWVRVTGISFQTLPNLTILEYENPRRVGNLDGGVKKGGLSIKLKLFIQSSKTSNIHQQADILKAWAMGDSWKPSQIVFDEEPTSYYIGRVANVMEITDNFTHGETEIEFYCADPRKYSTTETSRTSTNGLINTYYAGLESVEPIIEMTVTTACKNIRIVDVPTGKKISLIGNFTVGQKLVIDNKLKKVTLNGITSMKLLSLEHNWLTIEPMGTLNLKFETDTASVTNNFTIKYRTTN